MSAGGWVRKQIGTGDCGSVRVRAGGGSLVQVGAGACGWVRECVGECGRVG